MSREKWRIVPSLPAYMASTWGRIMTVPSYGEMPYGGRKPYGGIPWYGSWDGDRYIVSHRGKSYRVARLICEAFHGEPPHPKAVCMHLDEDSRNNRPSNLKWGTQKENMNAPGFLRYCRGRTGENSPTAKSRKKQEAA